MSYEIIYKEDYLEHHGILGMKWGVRRYQNADGSLTEEGRKHYGNTSRNNENRTIDKKRAIAKYGHDSYVLQKQAKKALKKGDEARAKEYNELQKQNRDKQKELRKELADKRVSEYGRNVAIAGELGKEFLRGYGLSLMTVPLSAIGALVGGAIGGPTGAIAGYGISIAALSVPVSALTIQSGYVGTRNIVDIADSDKIPKEDKYKKK